MFGLERLLTLRKSLSLNQREVATAINVTREAYSMYETGYRKPPFETLLSLADYFGVSLDYLVGRSEIRERFTGYSPKQQYIAKNLSLLSDGSINIIVAVINAELNPPSF